MVRSDPYRGPCSGKCQPGTTTLLHYFMRTYDLESWGCYGCRKIAGSTHMSLHAEGRAMDIAIPAQKKLIGDEIFMLGIFFAEQLGVQEIVWYRKIWSATRPYVRRYSGAHPHTDHVHIGLNWDGALGHLPAYANLAKTLVTVPQEVDLMPKINDAVEIVNAPGGGFWILQADGGVFSYSGAKFHGSVPALNIKLEVGENHAVDIIPTPKGAGYWVVGYDGGVFSFGDARYYGNAIGSGKKIIAGRYNPKTRGYDLIAADKTVFVFPK